MWIRGKKSLQYGYLCKASWIWTNGDRVMSSMFQLQPTLRRVATSQDQRTHVVVCYAQREARRHWFRQPKAWIYLLFFPWSNETLASPDVPWHHRPSVRNISTTSSALARFLTTRNCLLAHCGSTSALLISSRLSWCIDQAQRIIERSLSWTANTSFSGSRLLFHNSSRRMARRAVRRTMRHMFFHLGRSIAMIVSARSQMMSRTIE